MTSPFRPLIDTFSGTILSRVNAVSANSRGLIYCIRVWVLLLATGCFVASILTQVQSVYVGSDFV
jgi:hypothetical protein